MNSIPIALVEKTQEFHQDQDFFIIDSHLNRARQSNEKATRFFKSGRSADAMTQNKLTQIFIRNALDRLHRQCGDSGP
jgi:hypothetical protein